jgi:hypothetical protein
MSSHQLRKFYRIKLIPAFYDPRLRKCQELAVEKLRR